MIVAKRKPFEEIKEMLKGYKKVLNVGCGTCVASCPSGIVTQHGFTYEQLMAEIVGALADRSIQNDAILQERPA